MVFQDQEEITEMRRPTSEFEHNLQHFLLKMQGVLHDRVRRQVYCH